MGGFGKCRLVRFALRRLGVNGNYITEEWSRLALVTEAYKLTVHSLITDHDSDW